MANYSEKTVDFIKTLRKEVGLTQNEMSKRLNCSERTYRRIESGSMSLEELEDIANILDFTIILTQNAKPVLKQTL